MNLQEFLNSNIVEGFEKEVCLGERFKDENGNCLKFKIKALSQEEFEQARKKATTITQNGNVIFDNMLFNNAIVINNTTEPSFKDAKSIKELSCVTPEQYLNKVLLAGEINTLSEEIVNLSGFNNDINQLVEQAKN